MKAKVLASFALLVCLVLVNWSIYKKEHLLEHGQLVYLALAPVDPRSLMQGDYMALRFEMARQINASLQSTNENAEAMRKTAQDGYAIATLDNNQVGMFKGLYREQTLEGNEILMRYRLRNNQVKFATNAFFFQEGHAARYENAKFGGFRVAKDGELLLVSLHDENLRNLALD